MYNVLITGGGKGLGSAISKSFAADGNQVFINYLRDKAAAQETAQDIINSGGRAEIIQADVGRKEDIERMMGELPGIDIVVHNAVYPISGKPEEIQPEDWEKALAVNASALLYIAQHAFGHMKSKGFGRIYGISSSGAKRGVPAYIGVGTGKAAMEALIRYFATEWGKYGISANTVAPGAMDTEAFRSVFSGNADERLAYIAKRSPKRELVKFEDVGEFLVQLTRKEMGMITGQTISMDGGFTLLT